MLRPLCTSEFVIKDSFTFADAICKQQRVPYIDHFDVTSLFTQVPVRETILLCSDKLFLDSDNVQGLDRKAFERLLTTAVQENHFLFDGRIYDQTDGVSMAHLWVRS